MGTVERIESASPYSRQRIFPQVKVLLQVEEMFTGTKAEKVEVFTAEHEASCGFPFQRGDRYLVYAYGAEGKLGVSLCSRTQHASVAHEEIEFLRTLLHLPDTARVFGSYKRFTHDLNFKPTFTPSIMDHRRPPEEEYIAVEPVAGETVDLLSERGEVFSVRVDQNGRFEFTGLQPGKYKIRPHVPQKNTLVASWLQSANIATPDGFVTVAPKGCAESYIRIEADGRIRGRIVDREGTPLVNATIGVWRAEKVFELNRPFLETDSGGDGAFEAGPLPPGKFIVGAYVKEYPWGYSRCDVRQLKLSSLRFLGNATGAAASKVVELTFGAHQAVGDLRIAHSSVSPECRDKTGAVVPVPGQGERR